MLAQKIIVRPENHRKSVSSLTLIRSKSIVVYLGRWRTEKTHQHSAASGPLPVTRLLNVL